MIAVDSNILVHAHRADSDWHGSAADRVRELAEGRRHWAIPWPCIHEFVAVVTHPRIWNPPTPLRGAIVQVDAWLDSPSLVLLAETEGYWERLRASLLAGKVRGAKVHDARVAALCLHHDVDELWTADRDFQRFPDLAVRNPLV